MLTQEPTPQQIELWKSEFEKYKDRLKPNKKTTGEIIEYLKDKYPLQELETEDYKRIVIDTVIDNVHHKSKLPPDKEPTARVFLVLNEGAGAQLYKQQDEVFEGAKILIGIELHTAYFTVEGSSLLWDELFAFKGLDADDLKNYYLAAEYVSCLKRFNMLDSVITG